MSKTFSEKLIQLHSVITKNYENLDTLLEEYLATGSSIFNMELAIASHIENNQYIVEAVGPNRISLERGMVLNLEDTYCFEVFNQKKTIAFSDALKTELFCSHPAYLNLGLSSYISTPIYVEGCVYGTLNFSSLKVREEDFMQEDYDILEMMASSVGRFIEIRNHREKTINFEKMEAISHLAGGIAHEINNPMAIISSNDEFVLNYLKSKGTLDRDVEESLLTIKRTVARVKEIVSGLQIVIGGGDLSIEPIALRDLIDSTMALVWDKFRHGRVEIINDVSPEIIVYGSPVQLSQVILNLAQNSFDAIQGNENMWVNFCAERKSEFIEFSVIDSGTGIPQEIEKKIMEPFFTTKKVGKGTGLGLSLSKKIIEQCGGQFVYDKKSDNTCFKMTLSDGRIESRPAVS